jgi:hypothetical protein
MEHCPLEAVLCPDGVNRVPVTKIELEGLPDGRLRWILWSGDREIFSAIGQPKDHKSMMLATEWMVAAMTGVPKEDDFLSLFETN